MLNQFAKACMAIGALEERANNLHTCELSHFRHPWPPDQKCSGCRHEIDKFVKRNHLELSYILFGWNVIVEHFDFQIKRKIEQKKKRMESFIPVNIQKIIPGDYVVYKNRLHQIKSIYGVNEDGTLAKPSQGGFGVYTVDDLHITMEQAQCYHKYDNVHSVQ